MCQLLGLKTPNYYRWKKQREKIQHKIEQELTDIKRIETIFLESDKIYGYRMIAKELEKDGHYMSEHRIRRIMRENGFYPETRKKYKPTHNGKTEGRYCENLVKQNFKAGKRDMFRYIELFYNRERMHSVLCYLSPVEYRIKYDAEKVA
jgi:putative transposase